MPIRPFHPKAYLTTKRNVETGLKTRTVIIESIERQAAQAGAISRMTGLSYGSITYHLRILRKEAITEPTGRKRPLTWKLTRLGQQRLI